MNVLYCHGLSLGNIEVDVLSRKILDALKPGGVYFIIIIDHNAEPGSGTRNTSAGTASIRKPASVKHWQPASVWPRKATCRPTVKMTTVPWHFLSVPMAPPIARC